MHSFVFSDNIDQFECPEKGEGGLKNSGHDHEAALSGSWVECSADFSGCKV